MLIILAFLLSARPPNRVLQAVKRLLQYSDRRRRANRDSRGLLENVADELFVQILLLLLLKTNTKPFFLSDLDRRIGSMGNTQKGIPGNPRRGRKSSTSSYGFRLSFSDSSEAGSVRKHSAACSQYRECM